MNKSQLGDKLAMATGKSSRVTDEVVNIFFTSIKHALAAGDRVEIRGFGTFALRTYRAYTGRNPKTGEKVLVPLKKLPQFRTGKDLQDKLNAHSAEKQRHNRNDHPGSSSE